MRDREPTSEQGLSEKELLTKYGHFGRDLLRQIEELKQPLGHGTTSDHIDDILKHGLGTRIPDTAYAGTRSAFNLRSPDGLTGSYLFARFNTDDLRIKGEEDLIERYIRLNPKMTAERLRKAFQEYRNIRNPQGYPVVLVYDGEGTVEVTQVNPDAASEFALSESIDPSKLRALLVPDSKIGEAEKKVADLGLSVKIMPVEILEVLEQEQK